VDRDSQEEPLLGGNTHAAAVHIGDTVRRPTGAWTPAVHAVLAHLESRGVPAPRASAIDERRRESLGRSIRLLHNGMADFTPDPVWLRNAPGAGSPLVGRLARHQPRCLTHAAGVDDAGALRRIRAFVRGQVADNFPADTIAVAVERCGIEAGMIKSDSAQGHPVAQRLLADGHADTWTAAEQHIAHKRHGRPRPASSGC